MRQRWKCFSGSWVMSQNWSPCLDGSHGSQWPNDPWWNNCAVACNLLSRSIRPFVIAEGLILSMIFFCCQDRQEGCLYHHATMVPCVGWNSVMALGNGSCGSRVNCVMSHMAHASRKMTHFHLWYRVARKKVRHFRFCIKSYRTPVGDARFIHPIWVQ